MDNSSESIPSGTTHQHTFDETPLELFLKERGSKVVAKKVTNEACLREGIVDGSQLLSVNKLRWDDPSHVFDKRSVVQEIKTAEGPIKISFNCPLIANADRFKCPVMSKLQHVPVQTDSSCCPVHPPTGDRVTCVMKREYGPNIKYGMLIKRLCKDVYGTDNAAEFRRYQPVHVGTRSKLTKKNQNWQKDNYLSLIGKHFQRKSPGITRAAQNYETQLCSCRTGRRLVVQPTTVTSCDTNALEAGASTWALVLVVIPLLFLIYLLHRRFFTKQQTKRPAELEEIVIDRPAEAHNVQGTHLVTKGFACLTLRNRAELS